MSDPETSSAYILGHSDQEIARLRAQAALIDPITRRFFREAGVGPGMRVLDVGSGAGDVAVLASELVGSTGQVVGSDKAPAAIAAARARVAERSLANVSFVEGDPTELKLEGSFDAVIGRYVLQFQKHPASMLGKLADLVRPGGVVVFHEIDWTGLGSFPPVPTFDRCCAWCLEALRLHGTETSMGRRLHSAFVEAGLGPPAMRLEAPISGMPACLEWLEMFRSLVATLLPEMERRGIATPAEIDLDTLVERIGDEASKASSVIIGHSQVGAWVRQGGHVSA